MKESYEERTANDFGLQQWCDDGNNVVLSDCAEGNAGQPLNSAGQHFRVPTLFGQGEGNIAATAIGKATADTAES